MDYLSPEIRPIGATTKERENCPINCTTSRKLVLFFAVCECHAKKLERGMQSSCSTRTTKLSWEIQHTQKKRKSSCGLSSPCSSSVVVDWAIYMEMLLSNCCAPRRGSVRAGNICKSLRFMFVGCSFSPKKKKSQTVSPKGSSHTHWLQLHRGSGLQRKESWLNVGRGEEKRRRQYLNCRNFARSNISSSQFGTSNICLCMVAGVLENGRLLLSRSSTTNGQKLSNYSS